MTGNPNDESRIFLLTIHGRICMAQFIIGEWRMCIFYYNTGHLSCNNSRWISLNLLQNWADAGNSTNQIPKQFWHIMTCVYAK